MIAPLICQDRVVTVCWGMAGWTYQIEDAGAVKGEGFLSAPAFADFGMLVDVYNAQVGGGFNEFVCVLRRVPMSARRTLQFD